MEARLTGGEVIVTSRNAHRAVLDLMNGKLTPQQLNKGSFRVILCYVDVTIDFLNKFWEDFSDMDKTIISSHQSLTDDFIYDKRDELNWRYVSRYQKLSEELIRNLSDYVDWENIWTYQQLSPSFRKEFQSIANEWMLQYGKNVNSEVKLGKPTITKTEIDEPSIKVVDNKDNKKPKKKNKHKGYKKPEKYKNYYSDLDEI